jgi:hypothetical protein
MKRIFALISSLSVACLLFMPGVVGAEDVFNGVCNLDNAQNSTVCKSKDLGGENPLFGPKGVITTAITIVSAIVGIVAVIMIIIGGFKMVTSGNNPQDVEKARETIIYAIVGVIIAAMAQVIVQFFLKKIS